jgi:hypothetical protein
LRVGYRSVARRMSIVWVRDGTIGSPLGGLKTIIPAPKKKASIFMTDAQESREYCTSTNSFFLSSLLYMENQKWAMD